MKVVVLDASALVALLVDAGSVGERVAEEVRGAGLAAPELALYEVTNVLRRQALAGSLDGEEATLAVQDLLDLRLQLWPYATTAQRAWALRETLTAYDASYVALAEQLGADLVTLDARLARASGPRCRVLLVV